MPQQIYVGLPRSGKSYELVSQVILPALSAGRRVLTNVEGLDAEKIAAYIGMANVEERIIKVTDEDVLENPNFWYDPDGGRDSIVQPGDMIVLDEAFLLFKAGERIKSKDMLKFFRKHGHYVDEKGRPIDIALATQQFSDIHKAIAGITAKTIETRKLSMLSWKNGYRVRVYEGPRDPNVKSNKAIGESYRPYNKDIFPLYKSTSSGVYNENSVGRAASLLKSWTGISLAAAIALLATTGYYTYKKFNPEVVPVERSLSAGGTSKNESGNEIVKTETKKKSKLKYLGEFVARTNEFVWAFENEDGEIQYMTLKDMQKVSRVGPYRLFTLADGTEISEAVRPYRQVATQENNRGNNNAKNSMPGSSITK